MPAAPDLVREVLRLHFRGLTTIQIAHDVERHWRVVRNILAARGIRSGRHNTGVRAIDFTWAGGPASEVSVDPDWDNQ